MICAHGTGVGCLACAGELVTLRAELATVRAERDAAVEMVREALKYVVEDRAVTARATRLERWVDRARAYLASEPTMETK